MRFAACALVLLAACSGEAFSSAEATGGDAQLPDGAAAGARGGDPGGHGGSVYVASGGALPSGGATGGALTGGAQATGGVQPSGGVGNAGAGGYQGGSPSTGGVFATGSVPATGGVTTGGTSGSGGVGGAPGGGSAGGGAGGVATGGTSSFGTCVQVDDGTCGAEAQHWECDGFREGPYNPGYRCNPWAATLTGTWCCVPWNGGDVVSTCELAGDCADCAGSNTAPLCCRYDIETAQPLSPWTCGCGQAASCIPNVEAQ